MCRDQSQNANALRSSNWTQHDLLRKHNSANFLSQKSELVSGFPTEEAVIDKARISILAKLKTHARCEIAHEPDMMATNCAQTNLLKLYPTKNHLTTKSLYRYAYYFLSFLYSFYTYKLFLHILYSFYLTFFLSSFLCLSFPFFLSCLTYFSLLFLLLTLPSFLLFLFSFLSSPPIFLSSISSSSLPSYLCSLSGYSPHLAVRKLAKHWAAHKSQLALRNALFPLWRNSHRLAVTSGKHSSTWLDVDATMAAIHFDCRPPIAKDGHQRVPPPMRWWSRKPALSWDKKANNVKLSNMEKRTSTGK